MPSGGGKWNRNAGAKTVALRCAYRVEPEESMKSQSFLETAGAEQKPWKALTPTKTGPATEMLEAT